MDAPPLTDELRPHGKADEARLRDTGFRWGRKGTHTSRTIMLDELRALLANCRRDATRDDYLAAIQEDNCLGKRTTATRRLSSQRLSELYALDPEVPLFRVMRRCWYADQNGQAVLALLLALARDPLLRASAPPVLRMRPGEELARQQMTQQISSMNRLARICAKLASSFARSTRQSAIWTTIRTTVGLPNGFAA